MDRQLWIFRLDKKFAFVCFCMFSLTAISEGEKRGFEKKNKKIYGHITKNPPACWIIWVVDFTLEGESSLQLFFFRKNITFLLICLALKREFLYCTRSSYWLISTYFPLIKLIPLLNCAWTINNSNSSLGKDEVHCPRSFRHFLSYYHHQFVPNCFRRKQKFVLLLY